MSNKKKKPIIETHAKIEDAPTTLEQVWGFNEFSKYGTLDENVYQEQINEMNRVDLENQARKHGVLVVESTARLKESLITDFRRYISSLRKPVNTIKSTALENVDNEVKRILSEGR